MGGRRIHRESSFNRGAISGDYQYSVSRTVEQLREMGERVVAAAKASLLEGAELVVADAKSRCPVKTGKLRDSIKAVSQMDGAVYEISASAKNSKKIAYGQFVEFDPRINRPFLYPAMDANRSIIANDVKDAIKQAIDRGH